MQINRYEIQKRKRKKYQVNKLELCHVIYFLPRYTIEMVCALIGLIIFIYVSYRVYQHFFPTPDIDPRGKYVLISGCDTGFGNGLAIELDKQGFNVLAGVYSSDNKDSLTKILSSRAT